MSKNIFLWKIFVTENEAQTGELKKKINSGEILYLCLLLIVQGELNGNE